MKNILIVDDEANLRELYKDELEDMGYGVTIAGSGSEALGILDKSPDGFNLVMVDIKMPGMDGLELLGHIKEIRRDLPVIIVTAYDSYKLDFSSWAAEDYLVKSSDLTELKDKVRKYLT